MQEILKNARESLKEQLEYKAELDGDEVYFSGEDSDTIFEVTDSSVPIYTAELIRLAADNVYLATNEPELGPAFDGSPTPVNIIAANVFEEINNHLWECLEDVKEEITQEMLEENE
ncbi:MAG: hypothetical protein ACXAC2_17725 [Candidatus Kariarchaeaceae archaeon]|jgi:hypothetical protein